MLNKLAATAVVVAATTGGILLAAAPAYADTNAGFNADTNANGDPVGADVGAAGGATNPPGVISGNAIQVPVHVPINPCGNTAATTSLLNPTFGNVCLNH